MLHRVINSFSPSNVRLKVKCFIIKKLCILLETITKKFYNMVHWKIMLFNWNRSKNWSKHLASGGRVNLGWNATGYFFWNQKCDVVPARMLQFLCHLLPLWVGLKTFQDVEVSSAVVTWCFTYVQRVLKIFLFCQNWKCYIQSS